MTAFNPNTCYTNLFIDTLLFIVGLALFSMGLLIGLHPWIFPHWPIYYTSLFSNSFSSIPTIAYVLHGIYYIWSFQLCHACLTVLTTLVLGFAPLWITVLKEFICRRDGDDRPLKFQKACKAFRAPENITMLYRRVQILNILLLDIVSPIILPLLGVVSYMIIYCNFSLIKHWRGMETSINVILAFWAAAGMIGPLVVLTVGSSLYNLTQRALTSMRRRDHWGSLAESKYMAKFVKSLKPLSIGDGQRFVIRKVTILKFFKFIARGTAKALLTMR